MGFNINDIKWGVTKIGLKLWKHRSDIAFVTGIAGTVAGTILVVKASKKNESAIEQYKAKKEEIISKKDTVEEAVLKKETKDNTITIVKQTVKNYAIPVGVEAASYLLLLYSHAQLHSDLALSNAKLVTSVAALEAIKEKIVSAEGEDKWNEYAYGEKIESVVEVDSENNTTEHTEVNLGKGNIDFSVEFDESAAMYDGYKGANKRSLLMLENAWQDKITYCKEVVWLRNVWSSIFGNTDKFPKEWANAGWIPDCKDPAHDHVSFGIRPEPGKTQSEALKLFWDEKVPNVRLVFNCLPDVYEAA